MELVKNVKTNGHNTGTSGMDGHGASQADSWLLSLEQRQLLAPLVPLIPRHQWVRRHCRCCDRLPVAPSRAPLARCRWLRPRHLAREAPRLCLVETVLPSPEGVHLVPIDEAPASGSMLRAVCVLCGCVRE